MSDTAATTKPGFFAGLANPTRYLSYSGKILPWLGGVTALLLAVGLWMSFTAPQDYQQGETVRIMYVHVPSAWLSMMGYMVMAVSALGTLIWRHPRILRFGLRDQIAGSLIVMLFQRDLGLRHQRLGLIEAAGELLP